MMNDRRVSRFATLSGLVVALTLLLNVASAAAVSKATPHRALEQMPAREIAVFKDGHAFVLHEGEMTVNEDGAVEMDYLPRPLIGAFWPYSADPDARLASVVAGQRRVTVDRTPLDLRSLVEANVGARWSRHSWPSWWNQVNGVGRAHWELTLEPDQSTELNYWWYYFWR